MEAKLQQKVLGEGRRSEEEVEKGERSPKVHWI
jgi:hypothetical protein